MSEATQDDPRNAERDIFERDKAGEPVAFDDPEYPRMQAAIDRAFHRTSALNALDASDADAVRHALSELIGREVDASSVLRPPFYTDFGQNVRIGKNVFVNLGCTFMDRGGITLEDDVLIGPRVNLITTNHPLAPGKRDRTVSKPITIEQNAWVGVAATVLPGVTVGRNSVVSAGAVVTRDVPPNTVVAGVPASPVKELEADS